MKTLKSEINTFLIALSFLTRIPVGNLIVYSADSLNKSSRYFGLVGIIIGGLNALFYWSASQYVEKEIALWATLVFGLILTGCFHEDGLADAADGLGGGQTREKKLSIMKDSRLGTYGTLALVLAIFGKYILLKHLENITLAFLVAHCLSRVMAISLLFSLPNLSNAETSKPKPNLSKLSIAELLCLGGSAVVILLLLPTALQIGICLGLIGIYLYLVYFFKQQLGGVTGDCLGASQQIAELSIYFIFAMSI